MHYLGAVTWQHAFVKDNFSGSAGEMRARRIRCISSGQMELCKYRDAGVVCFHHVPGRRSTVQGVKAGLTGEEEMPVFPRWRRARCEEYRLF